MATRSRRPSFAALALCGGLALGLAGAAYGDSNALWNIVHHWCVPNEEQHGDPAPCRLVVVSGGEQRGYALLKDLVGGAQFLLIPTARIPGIESPALLAAGTPNYFAAAWRSRTYVEQALHRTLPREDLSLAVNSVYGRSQNQLHIHVDCVRADVRDTLRSGEGAVGDRWAPLGSLLAGHRYLAMRVTGEDLGLVNPFTALADGVPGARADMGRHTLVVVGATFPGGTPGFILLDDRADPAAGNPGSGEELQDHACAVARP